MGQLSFSQGISGILRNRCPKCQKGKVFSGLYAMNPKCPSCGLVFERESGYFIGAMMVGYFLGAFSALPTLGLLIFYLHEEIPVAIGLASLQIILSNPILFRLSRLTWIYLDHRAEAMTQRDPFKS